MTRPGWPRLSRPRSVNRARFGLIKHSLWESTRHLSEEDNGEDIFIWKTLPSSPEKLSRCLFLLFPWAEKSRTFKVGFCAGCLCWLVLFDSRRRGLLVPLYRYRNQGSEVSGACPNSCCNVAAKPEFLPDFKS